MARTTEFDVDMALKKATHLFWEKGYSNTSLRDLMHVMGIGQGSFYSFVKSKKALYLRCLQHYNDTVTKRRWDALTGAATFGKGIRAFFRCILDDLENTKTPNVCLMAGSLASDVLTEKDLARYVVGEITRLEGTIAARIKDAKRDGELPASIDAKLTASVIVTYLQGLFRVVRVLKSRKQMEEQINAVLSGLEV